ncbi:hypothetical protein ACIQPT_34995 [Streptomyces sp. NPDC091289]|uniref:hypothetical protein n=1 Tax=Streptomyces sp. NPDC091289 TaxID=3365989 RepID=UPI003807F71D
MTAFTSRLTLRAAVLAAVAAGAVLVPSTAAFADASPKPSEPASAAPSPERSKAAADAPKEAAPAVTPRGGVAAGDRPTPAPKEAGPEEAAPAVTPRGGVAAGERIAGSGDNSTTVLAGSVAGAALLAGAGTLVLRRRSAASGHNG